MIETQVLGSFILRFPVFWQIKPSRWISGFSNFSKGFWEEDFVKYGPLQVKMTRACETLVDN